MFWFIHERCWTDLLQISHHVLLVGPEYAAEEFYYLLIVQVVNTFNHAWQQQLHRQVKISVKFICYIKKNTNRVKSLNIKNKQTKRNSKLKLRPTSSCALLQELLYNLCLAVVAVVFSHHCAEFAKLPEEAVFVLDVAELSGQGAAGAGFGRRGRRQSGAAGAAGAASLRSWWQNETEQ